MQKSNLPMELLHVGAGAHNLLSLAQNQWHLAPCLQTIYLYTIYKYNLRICVSFFRFCKVGVNIKKPIKNGKKNNLDLSSASL